MLWTLCILVTTLLKHNHTQDPSVIFHALDCVYSSYKITVTREKIDEKMYFMLGRAHNST
jgi:hypothetical protein